MCFFIPSELWLLSGISSCVLPDYQNAPEALQWLYDKKLSVLHTMAAMKDAYRSSIVLMQPSDCGQDWQH